MSDEPQNPRLNFKRWKIKDWRIVFAVVLTFIWLVGWTTVALVVGWDSFWHTELVSLGGLEGLFAPMAFLWLVVGLFVQQKELSVNTAVLEQSNLQAAEQTRVLATTELRARQSAFFQIRDNIFRSTGTLLGYMITTTLGPQGKGKYKEKEIEEIWKNHGAGEFDRFSLMILADDLATEELLFANATNRSWTEDVVRNFRNLLRLANDCDDENRTISKSVTQSSLGYVYLKILPLLKVPSAWAMFDEEPTVQYSSEDVDVTGTWKSISETGAPEETFTVVLEQDSAKEVKGVVITSDYELDMHYGAVDGNRLFLSFMMMGLVSVTTAWVDRDLMRGTVQSREGLVLAFEARRISNRSK